MVGGCLFLHISPDSHKNVGITAANPFWGLWQGGMRWIRPKNTLLLFLGKANKNVSHPPSRLKVEIIAIDNLVLVNQVTFNNGL